MMGSIVFLSIALLMALAVAGVLMWVVLRPRAKGDQKGQAAVNAAVYRSQIADLDTAYQAKLISEQEWHQSRDEISVRLLEDTSIADDQPETPRKPHWGTAATLLIALPAASISLYLWLGTPDALVAESEAMAASGPQQELVKMADSLAAKLQAEPENVQGWVMLGRTYRTLGQFAASLQAYDRAIRIDAGDDLKLERAEAVAASNNGSFQGEPWRVIRDILQAQPQHIGALLLAGTAAYADQQPAEALQYWQRARARMTAEHPDVPALEGAIAEVQKQLGLAPAGNTPAPTQGVLATVSGRVTLSDSLKDSVRPDDTVFIYATQVNGPRMPVAIIRTTVDQLPLAFTLDDSTAMNPAFKLSTLSEVTVKARISKSGSAMSQPGDLLGTLGPVKVGQSGLTITISERMP